MKIVDFKIIRGDPDRFVIFSILERVVLCPAVVIEKIEYMEKQNEANDKE